LDASTRRLQEYEADAFALKEMLKSLERLDLKILFAVSALLPSAFLRTAAALRPEGDQGGDDHPPWSERFEALRSLLDDEISAAGDILYPLSRHAVLFADETKLVSSLNEEWQKAGPIGSDEEQRESQRD
jgi:hypothetical protein